MIKKIKENKNSESPQIIIANKKVEIQKNIFKKSDFIYWLKNKKTRNLIFAF